MLRGQGLLRLLSALVVLALVGPRCSEGFRYRGVLGQPISLNADSELPQVPVQVEGQSWRWTLLDVGSSVTLVPIEGAAKQDPSVPSESVVTLSVLESSSVRPGSESTVTRFEFQDRVVYDYDEQILDLGAAEPIEGILGTDVLGRFAVEIRLGPKTFTLFDAVDGSNSDLAEDGWAVFGGVYEGGGRTEAGCESPLPGRRLVVQACAFEDKDGSGTDLTLAVATNVVDLTIGSARVDDVAGESGDGERRLGRLAVVGNTNDELGPCEELAQRMEDGEFAPDSNGAAAVWIDDDVAGIAVTEIDDEDPAIVAARAEVGNATDAIDGFLGTAVLSRLRARLDYPGRRLLLRCESDIDCQTAPRSP